MSYNANKFVISTLIDNEFIITIKQTGTTLPMEIVNNEVNRLINITPTVDYTPYTPAVEYVAPKDEVLAVAGQEYIASVEGKTENYVLTVGTLVDNTTYDIVVNSTTYSLLYTTASYPDKYDYLIALKDLINAGATNTITTGVVDSNNLYLNGVAEGVGYTVNSSDVFYINETQTAVAPVVGQEYIAAVEYQAAVTEVPYVAAIEAHYKATNDPIAVDLTSLLSDLTGITKIEIQPEVTVASVVNDSGTVPLVNSWYDIGVDQTITITPVTNTANLVNPLPDIELKIKVTLSNTIDTFTATLVNSLDNINTGVVITTAIEDAANGKVKLSIPAAEAQKLTREVGAKEDRYYLKPNYKLLMNCNTLNNGNFIAKIDNVYVD